MKQIAKAHNVEYLKRLAKTIKKQQNITHQQALDIVAVDKGFNNWKHFLQNAKEKSSKQSSKNDIVVKSLSENEKVNPYRNLLVAAINELIDGNHISLNPIFANTEQEIQERGHIFLNLFGQPSVILWSNRGFEELLISVWWKYDHNKHPQANLKGNSKENFSLPRPLAKRQLYKRFVGVIVTCYLERKTGKYIQGKNREHITTYIRKGELDGLNKIPIQKPKGYKISGPFHL
ncbi:MAG: hypothetical protein KF900_13075 [Bacteroidetes bacterium]|nr:hypothetical protein [Bacteroidota bacterium]